jgi:hypothetical protein
MDASDCEAKKRILEFLVSTRNEDFHILEKRFCTIGQKNRIHFVYGIGRYWNDNNENWRRGAWRKLSGEVISD